MRTRLRKMSGRRWRFTARVASFSNIGYGRRQPARVVLLKDVRHRGEEVADHVWVEAGYWSDELRVGDLVEIQALVYHYPKQNKHDYALGQAWLLDVLQETRPTTEDGVPATDAVRNGAAHRYA